MKHLFQQILSCRGPVFWAMLCLALSGCVDTSTLENSVVITPDKSIQFLLIDNSLSYNNPENEQSQKVMDMVKSEIRKRLASAQPGDHYIVRTIQSQSNQLSAMISHLNLARKEFYFQQPKPSNPIELKVWEKQKRDFETSIQDRLQPAIEQAISEFETTGSKVFAQPSGQTDFVGALLTCQRFFEKRDYDQRKLIIYSDMIEDASLEDASQLDLSGVEVEARFVTRPATGSPTNTHQYFKDLETLWRSKLRADEFSLFEVQNSF